MKKNSNLMLLSMAAFFALSSAAVAGNRDVPGLKEIKKVEKDLKNARHKIVKKSEKADKIWANGAGQPRLDKKERKIEAAESAEIYYAQQRDALIAANPHLRPFAESTTPAHRHSKPYYDYGSNGEASAASAGGVTYVDGQAIRDEDWDIPVGTEYAQGAGQGTKPNGAGQGTKPNGAGQGTKPNGAGQGTKPNGAGQGTKPNGAGQGSMSKCPPASKCGSPETNPNGPGTPETNPNGPGTPSTNPNGPGTPGTNPNGPGTPGTNPNGPGTPGDRQKDEDDKKKVTPPVKQPPVGERTEKVTPPVKQPPVGERKDKVTPPVKQPPVGERQKEEEKKDKDPVADVCEIFVCLPEVVVEDTAIEPEPTVEPEKEILLLGAGTFEFRKKTKESGKIRYESEFAVDRHGPTSANFWKVFKSKNKKSETTSARGTYSIVSVNGTTAVMLGNEVPNGSEISDRILKSLPAEVLVSDSLQHKQAGKVAGGAN